MEFPSLSRRRFSSRNVSSGEEQEKNRCFHRLAKCTTCEWLYSKFKLFIARQWSENWTRLVSKHIFQQNLQGLIHHLHISQNAPCLPPKILQKHCFHVLLDSCYTQQKWKPRLCKIWWGGEGGQTRCIMGDVQIENGLNTVGKRVSNFCLKQFEAVFFV